MGLFSSKKPAVDPDDLSHALAASVGAVTLFSSALGALEQANAQLDDVAQTEADIIDIAQERLAKAQKQRNANEVLAGRIRQLVLP